MSSLALPMPSISFLQSAARELAGCAFLQPDEGFQLEFTRDEFGRRCLKVDALLLPDFHAGGDFFRDERTCHAIERIKANTIYQMGDGVDGKKIYHRKSHRNGIYTPYARQVMALLCRERDRGVDVVGLASNHPRELHGRKKVIRDGRELWCGQLKELKSKTSDNKSIRFVEKEIYTDVKGGRWLLMHGHLLREMSFGPEEKLGEPVKLGTRINDLLLDFMDTIDVTCRRVPGCGDFSIVATVKDWIRPLTIRIRGLETTFGCRGRIAREIDKIPDIDGLIHVDFHERGEQETPGGRTIVDVGNCLEDVEAHAFDAHGNRAHLTVFDRGLRIRQKNHPTRFHTWEEMGMGHRLGRAMLFEDNHPYMKEVRQWERISAVIWPSQERREALAALKRLSPEERMLAKLPTNPIEHPYREEQKQRRQAARMRQARLEHYAAA